MSRHQDRVRDSDRARDFRDATLVRLAHRHSLSNILTVDQEDFETSGGGNRNRLSILPERRRKV